MYNPYAMDIDRERNCYNCREFGHIVKNYRNWRFMGHKRRMEYGNNSNN